MFIGPQWQTETSFYFLYNTARALQRVHNNFHQVNFARLGERDREWCCKELGMEVLWRNETGRRGQMAGRERGIVIAN